MSTSLETLCEIYPSNPAVAIPLGLRVNEVVYGLLEGEFGSLEEEKGPEAQIKAAVEQLESLLQRAGAGPEQIESITAVLGQQASGVLASKLAAAFPGVDLRSRLHVEASPADAAKVQLHCLLRLANCHGQSTEAAPVFAEGEAGTDITGYSIGPVLWAPMLRPSAASGTSRQGDSVTQLRLALENAGRFLEAAGSGWHELARATVFMDPVDMRALNTAWEEIFPDPEARAPHKYVPARLPEGERVAVQVLAIKGALPRSVIELESIRHGDWMTMAALTGNIVTSSRVIAPRTEDPGEYTRRVLDNIEAIMKRAGGELKDLQQLTAFIGDASYRALVEDEVKRRWDTGATLPVMHFVKANLGGIRAPRIEILGLVGDGSGNL